MFSSSITDFTNSVERYKLSLMLCSPEKLEQVVSFVQSRNFSVINFGREVSQFIATLTSKKYLDIEVNDFIIKLLEDRKTKINDSINELVVIYNLGILLEPSLGLDPAKLLKEFSKTSCLVIIWENQIDNDSILHWPTQKNKYCLDFSGVQLKNLRYAI
ncbi:hypothetical protein [Adhaeribacter soli]|uniref:BREX-3 system P-loop-containing protein BrxF n=1 Tax=Adhaeribacter soli TaxID=2607655 RepID=A0A5N1ISN0_9BACT|nr:hypothetical protein [Adhaeribacter soli]KAA9332668.1 hypothetical protein F0P94_11715 [Adhaeribacter soli]